MAERRPWRGAVPVPGKETLWTPGQRSIVRANFVHTYATASQEERTLGKQFYPQWNEDAEHLGTRLSQAGLTHPRAALHEVGAAVLSHLSPSTEAEQNRLHAYQLVHHQESGDLGEHLASAAEHARAASSIRMRIQHGIGSGVMEAGGREHQELFDQMTLHKRESARARYRSGIVGSPLGAQPSRHIMKAIGAIGHEDPLSTLDTDKIHDFGHSIADPEGYHRAPVDTHWHDAGLGRTDIPYDTKRGLGASGRYNAMSHLASQAHAVAGDVSMPAFMATGWVHQQNLKVAENPSAARSRKSTVTNIGRMVSNSQFQHFMPEATGMRPIHMRD